jgi:1-acyl-sn-glycerol-3-phosphate acyltransferase
LFHEDPAERLRLPILTLARPIENAPPRLPLWDLSDRLRIRQRLTRRYRVQVLGAEHVPLTGPCILVANHESLLDPWFLSLATPRRVRFMAKAELWRYPGIRWAMEAYGTFPVERGSGDTGAMGRAGQLLEAGEVIGMFPRGTSKPTGNRVWHRGAARLALAHGVPIIPIRLVETRQLRPRRPVRVLVGEAIEVTKERPTIAAARALTARAEAAVEALA